MNQNEVTIIGPQNKNHVIYNVNTETVEQNINSDSVLKRANDVGMVSAMNTINAESQLNDSELREHYNLDSNASDQSTEFEPSSFDNEETFHSNESVNSSFSKPKNKPNKRKIDKRIDDLTYRLATKDDLIASKEEENRLLREQHEAELYAIQLSLKKEKINDDLQRAEKLMMDAQQEGDTNVYVKANTIFNRLVHEESQTAQELNALQQSYSQTVQNDTYKNEFLKHAEEKFYELSDARELNSPHYAEWLKKNDYYHAGHPNFDWDLAEEIHEIKKNFNKFLKLKKHADYIATPNYYNDLDVMIEQKMTAAHNTINYTHSPSYTREENSMPNQYKVHVNPEFEQSLPNQHRSNDARMHQSEPKTDAYYNYQNTNYQQNVAPVNRSNQHNYNHLPQLTELERQFAIMMPGFDVDRRPLTEAERIHNYRVELSKQQR